MLFAVILLLMLVIIAADLRRWRRLRELSPLRRTLFAAAALGTDVLLPGAILCTGFLARDNGTTLMACIMWMFWAWMVIAVPRLVCALFAALRLPRAGIVAGIGAAALFVWGATAGRTTLRVNRVAICSEKLPAAFDSLRVVQLSDMHVGSLVSPRRELRRLVDSVMSLRPDVVIFTGDLVNIRSTELDEEIRQLLSGIQAPLGVYSVLGNHDVGSYIKDTVALPRERSLNEVIERQQAMGWRLLLDTTVYLVRGSDSLSLSGISFDPAYSKLRHDAVQPPAPLGRVYRGVPHSLYNITAAHLPQLWEQVAAAGYGDLTLSGHVHAMQMKLRLFGRSYSPAQWFYPRWSGRYDDGPRTLYINDGTGYVAWPMRLGAWPEITLLTLRRCA